MRLPASKTRLYSLESYSIFTGAMPILQLGDSVLLLCSNSLYERYSLERS